MIIRRNPKILSQIYTCQIKHYFSIYYTLYKKYIVLQKDKQFMFFKNVFSYKYKTANYFLCNNYLLFNVITSTVPSC